MIALAAGQPAPLGASYDGKGVNFALFSAHAERVELCVFDEQGNDGASTCPRAAAISGTAGSPMSGLACATATASTGPGTQRKGTASTRRSCCLTPAAIR